MLKLVLLFSFFSFWQIANAQNSQFDYVNRNGDTIKLTTIESPTICDCIHKDYRNKDQSKICNRLYDYDFMSNEEREAYDERAEICRYPSVCDCALADMKDKGLLKACDDQYNYYGISETEIKEIQSEIAACIEKVDADSLDVCDCINIKDANLKLLCDEKYLNDELSKDEKEAIRIQMQECVSDSAYSIDVSVCDCALYADSDSEFNKACKEKYNLHKMDSIETANYLDEIAFCKSDEIIRIYIDSLNLPSDSSIASICDCIGLSDEQMKEKEKCLRQWNFSTMSETQFEAFKYIAQNCDKNYSSYNLSICFCMFEVYQLEDKSMIKKCEKYIQSISEKELQEFFKEGIDCFD